MPTTIDSAGITFNDATTLTSAVIPANAVGATQIANGSVTAAKLGTTEQTRIAKAWVNFNGTTSPGTIRSSYNVSSVTKNATGDYTVTFTTAMSDANYSVLLTGDVQGTTTVNGGYTAALSRNARPSISSFRFETFVSSLADALQANVAIFGN